jgi:hypothetical protein
MFDQLSQEAIATQSQDIVATFWLLMTLGNKTLEEFQDFLVRYSYDSIHFCIITLVVAQFVFCHLSKIL